MMSIGYFWVDVAGFVFKLSVATNGNIEKYTFHSVYNDTLAISALMLWYDIIK